MTAQTIPQQAISDGIRIVYPHTTGINKQCYQGYCGVALETLHRTLHYTTGNGGKSGGMVSPDNIKKDALP